MNRILNESDFIDTIIRRLILEFVMQYRLNPTINAPKKDNKSGLLNIVANLRSQITELKERIANM